jgi:hypothetical protein
MGIGRVMENCGNWGAVNEVWVLSSKLILVLQGMRKRILRINARIFAKY